MIDFGFNVLNPVINAFSKCLDWYFVFYGYTITVKNIFVFAFSMALVFMFISMFKD